MSTGALTSLNIAELSSLSAKKDAKNLPTTAIAAYFSDLNGETKTKKPGLRWLAILAATLHPMDLPKRKMFFSATSRTSLANW